jgi:hypothetical protein
LFLDAPHNPPSEQHSPHRAMATPTPAEQAQIAEFVAITGADSDKALAFIRVAVLPCLRSVAAA